MTIINNSNELDAIDFADSRRIKFGYFNASAAHTGYFSEDYAGFIITIKISMMDGSAPHTDSDSMQILFCSDSYGIPTRIKVRTKIDNVWGAFRVISFSD